MSEKFENLYMTAEDLQKVLKVSYKTALRYIKETQEEMKQLNYCVPEGKKSVALTKLLKKKFGF